MTPALALGQARGADPAELADYLLALAQGVLDGAADRAEADQAGG